MDASLQSLADAWLELRLSSTVLFVTGAGVSLASGIPTFRGSDPSAIWANDTTKLGTNAYFERDPEGSWSWYLSRFARLHGAQPNPAHLAIAGLERWHCGRGGAFLLVTQNVDGLHRAAGSEQLVEIHGRGDRLRCSRVGCAVGAPSGSLPRADVDVTAFLAAPSRETVPRCPACGALLRQHVLWFDEVYTSHDDYQFERVMKLARQADLVVFAGTSFAVGITELVLEEARGRAAVFSIDPTPRQAPSFVRAIAAPAELAFPELLGLLGG